MVSPLGFRWPAWPRGVLVAQPLLGSSFLLSLGAQRSHAGALRRAITWSISRPVVHGGLRRLPRDGLGHVLPPQLGELGVVGHVGAGGRPGPRAGLR